MTRPHFDDLEHPGYSDKPGSLRVFFDTEFTELGSERRLISIGLVSEDGAQTFYAELTDTWKPEDCSQNPFVLEHVLPLLEGEAARMTWADLNRTLRLWLEAFGQPVQLATDSLNWDWPWILELFRSADSWPHNLDSKPVLLTLSCLIDFEAFQRVVELSFASRLRRHHALDDAKANRLGWIAAGGDVEKRLQTHRESVRLHPCSTERSA